MHGAQHLSRRRSARDAGMASDSVSDTDSEFDRLFPSGGSKPARPIPASPVAAPAAPVAPARSRSASPPSAFSDVGDAHARRLLERQTAELPRILAELEASGRKTSHWAWWAFPTELCGASEPGPATRVSVASAATVVATVARAPREWRYSGRLGIVIFEPMHISCLYTTSERHISSALMAQWIRRETTDLEIQGSNPCKGFFLSFFCRRSFFLPDIDINRSCTLLTRSKDALCAY